MMDDNNTLKVRMNLCAGLVAAVDHGAEIFAAIQASEDSTAALAAIRRIPLTLPEDVRTLIDASPGPYWLDDEQARLVLDLRMRRAARDEQARLLAEIYRLADSLRSAR